MALILHVRTAPHARIARGSPTTGQIRVRRVTALISYLIETSTDNPWCDSTIPSRDGVKVVKKI